MRGLSWDALGAVFGPLASGKSELFFADADVQGISLAVAVLLQALLYTHGTGVADERSLVAAIREAASMAERRGTSQ